MKFFKLFSFTLAAVIFTGAVVFAVGEFAKARNAAPRHRLPGQLFLQEEKKLHQEVVKNSETEMKIRALQHDPVTIDKAVKDRLLRVRPGEVLVEVK